jgi:hypothetical protein
VSSTATTCLTATATAGGSSPDVSSSVTWVSNDTSIVTVQNGQDPMCPLSSATPGATTVYATYISGTNIIKSNTVTVTVSP